MVHTKTVKRQFWKVVLIAMLSCRMAQGAEYVQSSNVYIGGAPLFTFETTYNWREKDAEEGGKSYSINNLSKGFFVSWGSFLSENLRTEIQVMSTSYSTPAKFSISSQAYMINAYYDIFSLLLLDVYAGAGGGVSYTTITDIDNLKGSYNITTQAKLGINIKLPFNLFIDASYTYLTTPARLQFKRFATQSFPIDFKISGPSISLYKSF